MIELIDLENSDPYQKFESLYKKAVKSKQRNIEAISISSFDVSLNEVQSRLVNLKFVKDNQWIFFSNYDSPKSKSFNSHQQISGLIFWNTINVQIRLKANIEKTSKSFNESYFKKRSKEKNALAISSNQSSVIESYREVISKYEDVKISKDLTKCPNYWGGFKFIPYEIEFWKGNEFRLNKRDLFKKRNKGWEHFILEP